ncbi:MAG TPA: hypothetical protein VKH20_00465 [Solirubrobacterales bacterium]|nr:hypothetical protein [Solirubrobacterales bacterium]
MALIVGMGFVLVAAGCGSGSESPNERAGDLREAGDQIEGELLLNEVEEWSAEYAIVHEANDSKREDEALREVRRVAHACWDFGLKGCSEQTKVESVVQSLEEEAHQKISWATRP